MQEAIREIRRALLDADVNLRVVKAFISSIKDKAEGEKVLEGVNPSQQLIKIVNDELVALLGKEQHPLNLSAHPSLIMMLGLQGSGKTTSGAKLAVKLKKEGKTIIIVTHDKNVATGFSKFSDGVVTASTFISTLVTIRSIRYHAC